MRLLALTFVQECSLNWYVLVDCFDAIWTHSKRSIKTDALLTNIGWSNRNSLLKKKCSKAHDKSSDVLVSFFSVILRNEEKNILLVYDSQTGINPKKQPSIRSTDIRTLVFDILIPLR